MPDLALISITADIAPRSTPGAIEVRYFLVDPGDAVQIGGNVEPAVTRTKTFVANWYESHPLKTPPIIVAAIGDPPVIGDEAIRKLLAAGVNLCVAKNDAGGVKEELQQWLAQQVNAVKERNETPVAARPRAAIPDIDYLGHLKAGQNGEDGIERVD